MEASIDLEHLNQGIPQYHGTIFDVENDTAGFRNLISRNQAESRDDDGMRKGIRAAC